MSEAPTLVVDCRRCHREIPTPVAESSSGGSGALVTQLRVRCPNCGLDNDYSSADCHPSTKLSAPPTAGPGLASENLASEHDAKLKGDQARIAGYGVVPPEGRSPHEG
jgi:hypothetical protein